MDELGHILREARENKGLTLEAVQSEIRINTRYLKALEDGDYAQLPTPVHVRGFLRNYARFLGLDPQPLLERYQYSQNYQPSPVVTDPATEINLETPLPERQDQPFFDPVNVEVDIGSRRDPESALRLIIIAALIITLALVANRFVPLLLNNRDGSSAITEGVTQIIEDILNREEESEAIPDFNATLTAGEIITSTSRTSTGTVLLPSPTPTRPALPATLESIDLQLDITERTWMEVTIDGDVVFSGIALDGDAFSWTAAQEAKILTGNAIGVVVTINDIALGRLGARGENKEEIWRTTN